MLKKNVALLKNEYFYFFSILANTEKLLKQFFVVKRKF